MTKTELYRKAAEGLGLKTDDGFIYYDRPVHYHTDIHFYTYAMGYTDIALPSFLAYLICAKEDWDVGKADSPQKSITADEYYVWDNSKGDYIATNIPTRKEATEKVIELFVQGLEGEKEELPDLPELPELNEYGELYFGYNTDEHISKLCSYVTEIVEYLKAERLDKLEGK